MWALGMVMFECMSGGTSLFDVVIGASAERPDDTEWARHAARAHTQTPTG